MLKKIGALLEIKGENEFKVRAYYNGAKTIDSLEEDIHVLVREDRLKDIKGIGKALNEKISEYVNTGELHFYNKLMEDTPKEIFEFLRIPGLGPKKVRELYNDMEIKSIGELEYACSENRLLNYKGFGEKTQEKILEGIKNLNMYRGKMLYSEAIDIAHNILTALKSIEGVLECAITGELRRKYEIVSSVDIVISANNPDGFINSIDKYNIFKDEKGVDGHKVSGTSEYGLVINLYIVPPHEYITALFSTTGSYEHVETLRTYIGAKSLCEIGLEEEIYKSCSMDYIEPELREGKGEIDAALSGRLPGLVTNKDIRGVFHVHTNYSDGANTIAEMAAVARAMGYFYIGIGDHSKSSYYAGGLSETDIRRQLYEISQFNDSNTDIKVLKGIECDILENGSLDYDDSILELFDYVIVSVHSGFSMSEERMTERLKRAISNKYATIIGHFTGRLLLAREPYKLNLDKIIDTVVSYGKVFEINANPHRMDIDWRIIKEVKNRGAKFAINPDAHNVRGIYDTVYGVNIARKGWLEPQNIINTMDLNRLNKFLSIK